ncbi:MAG: 3-oxoacyl-ACP reductase FabG [Deltaproteobacteria bacterium]|nr:3-oxoacyl-ACP reductase FabG [Deltaproteobacteria bacterium]MBW2138562.1 3-oxoacyl-ACP reductase FabG [Deltaproteobacteria bacterium]
MRLKDKVAIVTGAARGIGEAIVCRFIEEGARVTMCDVDKDALSKVHKNVREMGGSCLAAVGDIVDRNFVQKMVDDTLKEFGTLDVMVNNAAITRDAILHKMTEEQWNQVIDVNLKGTFNCLQAAAIHMRKQGRGRIINISSTARFGNIGQLNYSASKGGVVSLTRTAAKELALKGVTCNCISPGTIWTDMMKTIPEKVLEKFRAGVPLGRFGDPREVAHLAVFLASDEASYITGQTINCDGGSFMA